LADRAIYRRAAPSPDEFPINSNGQTISISDAHRGDGKRFIVHADEKLSAFVELERITRESLVSQMPNDSAQLFARHEVNRA
jgi:hypothetical protein